MRSRLSCVETVTYVVLSYTNGITKFRLLTQARRSDHEAVRIRVSFPLRAPSFSSLAIHSRVRVIEQSMAPTPTEDVDFSVLCDKILEALRALWAFVSGLCLALWSYISQGFWAAWTYPPFETFRNEFVAALIALTDYGPSRFPPYHHRDLQMLLTLDFFSDCTSHDDHSDHHPRVRCRPDGAQHVHALLFVLCRL